MASFMGKTVRSTNGKSPMGFSVPRHAAPRWRRLTLGGKEQGRQRTPERQEQKNGQELARPLSQSHSRQAISSPERRSP
jgi:hypothetical protein